MDPVTGLIILSLFALGLAGCSRDDNGGDSGAQDAGPPDLPIEGGRHERDIPDAADARDAGADFVDANADTNDARLDEYRYDSFEYSDRPGDAARELSDLINGDSARDFDFSETSADSREAPADAPHFETGRDMPVDRSVPDIAAEHSVDVAPDRRPDAGVDIVLDAGVDYPLDAGVDRAPDAALDGGVEAAVDLPFFDIIDVNLDSISTDAAVPDSIDLGREVAADLREVPVDAPHFETGRDIAVDHGAPDIAAEHFVDVAPDRPPDSGVDIVLDAGVDYPLDAGVDRAPDAGLDGGVEAPVDLTPVDIIDVNLDSIPIDAAVPDSIDLGREVAADLREAPVDVPHFETGRDMPVDRSVPDIAAEHSVDVAPDRPPDSGVDTALDAGVDYPLDAGVDRAPDAALDVGVDTSVDLTPVDIIDVNLDSIPIDATVPDSIDLGREVAADLREAPVDAPVFEIGRDAAEDVSAPDLRADSIPDAASEFSLDAGVESIPDAGLETLSDRTVFDVHDRSLDLYFDAYDTADTTTPEPGINYNAFTFTGPISDLDSPEAGVIIALGGSPAKLYRCTVSGIAPATCDVMAEFNKPETGWSDSLVPAGMDPIDYFSVDGGVGLVNFWSSSDRGRIILAKLNETAPVSNSVVAYDTVENPAAYRDWRLLTGGIAAAHVTTIIPTHWRFFTPIGSYNPARHLYTMSAMWIYSDEHGSPLRRDLFAYSNGYNPSCAAIMRMNLPSDAGVAERSVLVLYSAGLIDAAHHYPARLAVHDPVSDEARIIKTISVGDVDAENLPECSVAPSMRDIHMIYGNPARRFASVNIETDAATEIPLGASLTGNAAGITGNSSNAYIADSAGRIIFLDLSGGTVLGRKTLPDAPTAVVVSGSYVYSAAGNRLIAIDPATVGLE